MPSGGLVRHWKAGTDLLTFGSGLPEAESGSRGGGRKSEISPLCSTGHRRLSAAQKGAVSS